ncbi:ExeM/NucH family extracellular endonuclease [Rheinheimera sp. 1928-s]|uniref:ExeM/NucH family extracellular endonuclease n=1 Tax=Rheinheimera sp. 1928-s TaxID=3033803 RepID=UPI002601640D|nr:ExeM/NucH family extracellular endonuclease [Rheinheimera sp. 1928-s]MDF3125514.1 ExeM/NucH family extracellular endonuclease [Rheinheimera sp. 1928-s]
MSIKNLCAVAVALALSQQLQAELLISEYLEGSSNNKAIELVNLGSQSLDLSQYKLQMFFNGNTTAAATINLTGTLAPGAVYVIANNNAVAALKDKAQLLNSSSWYNGDDALVLSKGELVIDSFGQVGFDPGSAWNSGGVSTLDKTLRRKASITQGDSNPADLFDPSLEYEQFAQDDFSDIGFYNGSGPTDPEEPEPEEPVYVHGQCGDVATFISAIQGETDESPLKGQTLSVEAVVTASYQDNSGLKGFFIQEEMADQDQNPLTSEGVFVYDNLFGKAASVGDKVRVSAVVEESFGQTQLAKLLDLTDCGEGEDIAAVAVTLPVSSLSQLEALEGMKVRLTERLTVTDNYGLGRYNELTLSSERLYQPTQIALPGDAAKAVMAANSLNKLVLDDGSNLQNKDQVYPAPGLSASNTLRVGDEVLPFDAVLGYGFSKYRVHPLTEPVFISSNPRTEQPAISKGDYRIASINVLNYFNGDGTGIGFPTSRGASTAVEFAKQRSKIIAAIAAMNADLIGLLEMENDGFSEQSALADLVRGLNEEAGADVWAFVDFAMPQVGTDAITSAIIYRKDKVTQAGLAAVTTAVPFDYGNRALISQSFKVEQSAELLNFTVVHLRSKGSCPSNKSDLANLDSGDGQGCWNAVRLQAVQAMHNWLAGHPTGVETDNSVIVGDFNAYMLEDPIRAMNDAGYVQLSQQAHGNKVSSYQFNGESGSLDHVFAAGDIRSRVAEVTEWAINADEPAILDYNEEYKSDIAKANFYAPGPFRSSDHDPMVMSVHFAKPVVQDQLFMLDEQAAAGTVVGQIVTSSAVAIAHYQLSGEQAAWFNISSTGQLMVAAGADLDFESRQVLRFDLTVQTESGLVSEPATIEVQLNDLPELPVVTLEGLATVISDQSKPGTVLATVTAQATGNNAVIEKIQLVEGDKYLVLKNGQLTLKKKLNAKHQPELRFSIKATDSLGVSTSVSYVIEVKDGKSNTVLQWVISVINKVLGWLFG